MSYFFFKPYLNFIFPLGKRLGKPSPLKNNMAAGLISIFVLRDFLGGRDPSIRKIFRTTHRISPTMEHYLPEAKSDP